MIVNTHIFSWEIFHSLSVLVDLSLFLHKEDPEIYINVCVCVRFILDVLLFIKFLERAHARSLICCGLYGIINSTAGFRCVWFILLYILTVTIYNAHCTPHTPHSYIVCMASMMCMHMCVKRVKYTTRCIIGCIVIKKKKKIIITLKQVWFLW